MACYWLRLAAKGTTVGVAPTLCTENPPHVCPALGDDVSLQCCRGALSEHPKASLHQDRDRGGSASVRRVHLNDKDKKHRRQEPGQTFADSAFMATPTGPHNCQGSHHGVVLCDSRGGPYFTSSSSEPSRKCWQPGSVGSTDTT